MNTLQRAVADSILRAEAAGETWVIWRLVGVGLVFVGVVALIVVVGSEFMAVRRAGGVKAYVSQGFDAVSYGAIRGIWATEVVIGIISIAIVLHALAPKLVSELQIEAVVALFTMVAATRGINFGAFWAKRATEDPAVSATRAAIEHPDVMPVVTTNKKTGETTVNVVATPASLQPPQTTTTEVTTSPTGDTVTTKVTASATPAIEPVTAPTIVKPPPVPKKHAARDD